MSVVVVVFRSARSAWKPRWVRRTPTADLVIDCSGDQKEKPSRNGCGRRWVLILPECAGARSLTSSASFPSNRE